MNHSNGKALDSAWKSYKATGDLKSRNYLVMNYYYLTERVAKKRTRHLSDSAIIYVEDLAQEGVFGLVKAIDRYTPNTKVKFETFAFTVISRVMIDAQRRIDLASRLTRKRVNQYKHAKVFLQGSNGKNPTDEQMGKYLGLTPTKLRVFLKDIKEWDLRYERLVYRDKVKKSVDPFLIAARKDTIDFLLRGLTTREKKIIILYHYEGLSMEGAGLATNLTRAGVSQIHKSTMKRIKERIAGRKDLEELVA